MGRSRIVSAQPPLPPSGSRSCRQEDLARPRATIAEAAITAAWRIVPRKRTDMTKWGGTFCKRSVVADEITSSRKPCHDRTQQIWSPQICGIAPNFFAMTKRPVCHAANSELHPDFAYFVMVFSGAEMLTAEHDKLVGAGSRESVFVAWAGGACSTFVSGHGTGTSLRILSLSFGQKSVRRRHRDRSQGRWIDPIYNHKPH